MGSGVSSSDDRGRPGAANVTIGVTHELDGPSIVDADLQGPLRRGEAVGRYVVLELVGQGGMSIVYAAYDPELDRRIALKVMRPRSGEQAADDRARLLREAQAIARLSHPNVVAVHDVGTFGLDVFVAMEFVDGGTLRTWCTERVEPDQDFVQDWTAALEVLVRAGDGLFAAHQAGLVHRDFKPDNVLVGSDGRVCVTDFGLAYAVDRDDPDADDADDPDAGTSPAAAARSFDTGDLEGVEDRLRSRLTRDGAVLGTPRYMPPEQHLAEGTDARSDQFSFCVAAYEALYGSPPYGGRTIMEIVAALTFDDPKPPPRDTLVPAAVGAALLRGLSRSPAQRWPDMAALLTELRRDHGGTRRRVHLALGGIALVGVGAAAAFAVSADSQTTAQDPCGMFAHRLDEVWSPQRAQQLDDVFEAKQARGAVVQRLQSRISEWVGAWHDEATSACVANQVDRSQSDEMFDLRMACLDRHRQDLRARLDVLTSGDPQIVDTASVVVGRLPAISECADFERLRDRSPLPGDPQLRATIAKQYEELAEVSASMDAGQSQPAMAKIDALIASAQATDHAPLIGRVRGAAAVLYGNVGQVERAEAEAYAAANEAARGRDDLLALRVWTNLAYLLAEQRDGLAQALMATRAAEAAYYRARAPLHFAMQRLTAECIAYTAAGQVDQALQVCAEAAELEDQEEIDPLQSAGLVGNYAVALQEAGHYAKAREMFERAYAAELEWSGPDHPNAAALLHNLGNNHLLSGEFAAAKGRFEQAIAVQTAAVGPGSPQEAGSRIGLAQVLVELRELDAATDNLDAAAAIYRELFGDAVPWEALVSMVRSQVWRARGALTTAAEHARHAIADMERFGGADNREFGLIVAELAAVELDAQQFESAAATSTSTIEALAASRAPEHPAFAEPLVTRGRARFALGQLDAAADDLERALAIYEAVGGDRRRRGLARWTLAQTLRDLKRDPERVRALCRAAVVDLDGLDEAAAPSDAIAACADVAR